MMESMIIIDGAETIVVIFALTYMFVLGIIVGIAAMVRSNVYDAPAIKKPTENDKKWIISVVAEDINQFGTLGQLIRKS